MTCSANFPSCNCLGDDVTTPCAACAAKDKTITELIAALSLQREPVWPVQHPHPPWVPSVSPSLPIPTIFPTTTWPFPQAPYIVTCQN